MNFTVRQKPGLDDCPACGGIGWQRVELPPSHPRYGELMPCENCGELRRLAYLRDLSRLSDEMQTWTLDAFKTRRGLGQVVPQLRRAIDEGWGWVTLSGPPGVGKTYLLAAIANESVRAGVMAIYTTVADLFGDLRGTFDPKSNRAFPAVFQNVLGASVLCLDEIEKWRATAWAEEVFFRLVEERYRRWPECLTVLATNRQIGLDKQVLVDTAYPGYLESRIMDGRFWQLDQFWKVGDARPALRREA